MTKTTDGKDAAAKRAGWVKQIRDWERSGQTQRAFCAKRGLALSSFQWWRGRLDRDARERLTAPFVPLALRAERAGVAAVIEVELRSRTRLRLEGEAALQALDRVVARIRWFRQKHRLR